MIHGIDSSQFISIASEGCEMRRLREVLICIIALLIIAILIYLLLPKSGGYLKTVSAKLYVNGHYVDDTAILYWYNKEGQGPARFSLPLTTTLKALGCEIEGDGLKDGSELTAIVGNDIFIIERHGSGSSIYKNDEVVLMNAARPKTVNRGPLYMNDFNYEEILTVLGFNHISCEIGEEEKTVNLYAELGR